ncbi:MAG: hypothetical protein J7L55_04730 [Desulfurococcales archaeon]|nr:hypothetical protein [Desulfurococcales archaeon]
MLGMAGGKKFGASKPKGEGKERRTIAFQEMDEKLLRRAAKTAEGMDVITPSAFASALNIRLSLARKVLRELASAGKIEIIAKSRSTIVAVPIKK